MGSSLEIFGGMLIGIFVGKYLILAPSVLAPPNSVVLVPVLTLESGFDCAYSAVSSEAVTLHAVMK